MGLSEFISKNNNERPDPKVEWEKSMLLIKTIDESGAVKLLEQLQRSILSNPVFNHDVELKRTLFVYNESKVEGFMKSSPSLAGSNPAYQNINVRLPSKYSDLDSVPTARVEFNYNRERKGRYVGILNPQFELYSVEDTLGIDCSEVGTLKVWHVNPAFGRPIVMQESQWRIPGALDNALGELYSESPAKKLGK